MKTETPISSLKIGKHDVQLFDDWYQIAMHGEVTEEDAKKINEIQHKYFINKRFFTICDMREMGNVSPAARKQFANSSNDNTSAAIALWGGSFQTRLLANLILNAINLVKKNTTPSAFFKTEEEAFAWIEQKRKEPIKK